MQLWEELLLTRVKKFYVVGEKSQKCQKPGWWKTGVFVCIVSDIRNKVVKQHIAGKILAMQHMSWLLKVFHFIVERLPFSREVFWFCMVLLCLVFFSNEPNDTRSAWAEEWQTWGPCLLSIWGQVQILGCILGCLNNETSGLSHFKRGRELCLFT